MKRSRSLLAAGSAAAITLALAAAGFASASAGADSDSATSTRYGPAVDVGRGTARTYVITHRNGGAPVEIGVALDEGALEGLPTTGIGHHGAGGEVHEYDLALPARHGTPFEFLGLNWNPAGHEPDGVYQGAPHFDFHFYTIPKSERDGIVPTDARYAERANRLPGAEYVPPFTSTLAPDGVEPAAVAVPLMGVHWLDVRSPELQRLLGKPEAYEPFTRTFIHGSWDGKLTFWEPMVTRAHMLAKRATRDPAVRDEVIPIPLPARYDVAGYYPDAYRIAWDAKAKEYRIALTGLAMRE